MGKKKIILYFFVITITVISLNIQLQSLVKIDEKQEYKNTMRTLEYYPFQNMQEREEKRKEQKEQQEENQSTLKEQEEISQQKETGEQEEILPQDTQLWEPAKDKTNINENKSEKTGEKDLYRQQQFIKDEQKEEKSSGIKDDLEVVAYTHLEEISKEIGLKDKAILYGLIKNMDKTNMTYIKEMMENGLTKSEVARIQNILKRVLEPDQFKQAQVILEKYIPTE